ncbi:hypothetical protein BRC86_12855 [Halobacteriales archaeon QS_3_64_16]|nr:MAG: hypothetical protein BRC86_12855 [Halobacteriales archaeon QS_3_64_16]
MAISATVANDLLDVFEIDVAEDRQTMLVYLSIGASGLLIALVALSPPPFLVVSILWAFSLAAAITPVVVLGVWSSRVNRYGAVPASVLGAVIVIVFSPHVLSNITFGAGGITSALGMDAAFVAVPLSVIVLVTGSLLGERFAGIDPREHQSLLNEIHGYPDDGVERFTSAWPLVVLALLSVPLLLWGLAPWPT